MDFHFLSAIGWREAHLGFTVIVPLIMSGVTIVLLRNLTAIAHTENQIRRIGRAMLASEVLLKMREFNLMLDFI